MSAWVVEKAHVNLMVNAGMGHMEVSWYWNEEHHRLTADQADRVGQMLMDECVRSVAYRYDGSDLTDLPGRADADYVLSFKHRLMHSVNPVVVLKQISCYEYQSCETPDWEETEAHAFCQALRKHMIGKLPGYEAAPWGWDEWPTEKLQRLIG